VKEADQKPLDSVELERLVMDQKSVIEALTKRATEKTRRQRCFSQLLKA
jgi:hypothetical protein